MLRKVVTIPAPLLTVIPVPGPTVGPFAHPITVVDSRSQLLIPRTQPGMPRTVKDTLEKHTGGERQLRNPFTNRH